VNPRHGSVVERVSMRATRIICASPTTAMQMRIRATSSLRRRRAQNVRTMRNASSSRSGAKMH